MCHYHQTSPESPFTRQSLCSRATAGGRITLSGRTLIVTHNGEREEQLLNSEAERQVVLREYFKVVL